jgi:outer membrane lipoprotein-sorting protein
MARAAKILEKIAAITFSAAFATFPPLYTQIFEETGRTCMIRCRALRACALFLAILPTTACLFHRRPVEDQYSKATLKESSQQGLIDEINQEAQQIQSLQATVNIDTSAGGVKKGQITDYKEIRGTVLARKPDMLHMIGLMPIVRTTAFDMVSNGQDFKLWIPPKNRFVMGKNEVQSYNPDQPMENIRPQQIYDALLVRPIQWPEVAVLENGYETLHDAKGRRVLQDDYELVVIRMTGEHDGKLSRKIVFSRIDLQPRRQFIYDDSGKLVTDAHYGDYKEYTGVEFPSRVEIVRPQEEYDITLIMLKVEINKPLKDEQFVLQQPAGADVVHLDGPQSSAVRVLQNDGTP